MKNSVRFIGEMMRVAFLDLRREQKFLHTEISLAMKRVIARANYVLGDELNKFEKEFAKYIGVKYAIGVGSGTEALHLSLIASGVKNGDEVITATNTCGPTISAIMASGAVSVLADTDPLNYCLDVREAAKKISKRTKAILPVHLYGQMADMGPLVEISKKYGIPIIEDCAQSHGARYKNKMSGSVGISGCFSFYPTKNMGAFGDAGIITTNNKNLDEKCRLLRNYGQKTRYKHLLAGFNSRLDELQAAILRVKLKRIEEWNRKRRFIAKLYSDRINNPRLLLPKEAGYAYHVYHLYVIQVMKGSRAAFQKFLAKHGISTLVHYPIPMHRQKFYTDQFGKKTGFPVAERMAGKIVSLPLYPYMKQREVEYIIDIANSYR